MWLRNVLIVHRHTKTPEVAASGVFLLVTVS